MEGKKKNRRDRLIIFLPIIVSVALVIGILLGNWITGIRIRSIVSNEISNQKFSIRPGNNAGSGFSLTPKANKISSALQYILRIWASYSMHCIKAHGESAIKNGFDSAEIKQLFHQGRIVFNGVKHANDHIA